MYGTISTISGEYRDAALEAGFRQAHFDETARQCRLYFITSVVLNLLFFVSDWRFYGDPHFWVAIPARAAVVLTSVVCLCLVDIVKTPAAVQRVLIGYGICVAVAVGFLVTSHSQIALFAVIVLPAIYYLALPNCFTASWKLGLACSIILLTGYIAPHPDEVMTIGLILAMATMNVALTLIVSRTNRLRRLEWAATQSALSANMQLDTSRKLLEQVFMAVPIPLIVTEHDSGQTLNANRAALTYFNAHETVGEQGDMRAAFVNRAQREDLLRAIDEHGHVDNFEITVAMPDGSRRDMLLAGSRVTLNGRDCVITGGIDISARKAMEARLEELATRDPLTGVLNRTAFFERAHTEMDRARRMGLLVSVIMIDLDYFKVINDTYGHAAGDLTLKAFADLCCKHLRAHDFVGRLGGEEFACLLTNADGATAASIAERLRHAAEGLRLDQGPHNLRVTVSIGVSEVDLGDEGVSPALARADLALYGAKMRGRNKVVIAGQREEDVSLAPSRIRTINSVRN